MFWLLAGCAAPDVVKVSFVPATEADLAGHCPALLGKVKGCAYQRGDVTVIYALAPKNVLDLERLATIGHEFYCHAWLRQSHYDSRGVRKDPSNDCVP